MVSSSFISAIATVLLLVSREPHRLWEWLGTLSVAMAIEMLLAGIRKFVQQISVAGP